MKGYLVKRTHQVLPIISITPKLVTYRDTAYLKTFHRYLQNISKLSLVFFFFYQKLIIGFTLFFIIWTKIYITLLIPSTLIRLGFIFFVIAIKICVDNICTYVYFFNPFKVFLDFILIC